MDLYTISISQPVPAPPVSKLEKVGEGGGVGGGVRGEGARFRKMTLSRNIGI